MRAISLGDLPGRIERATLQRALTWSCSGRGLPCPRLSRAGRWALTPPFHPCLVLTPAGVRTFGGLFSVALSKDRSFSPWCGACRRTLTSGLPCGVRTFLPTTRLRLDCTPSPASPAKMNVKRSLSRRSLVVGRPSAPLPRVIILLGGGGCTKDLTQLSRM